MSFDPSLGTDRDWVRLLVGDTDTANEYLTDAEYDMVVTEQTAGGASRKYFAAALALPMLYAKWNAEGKGVVDKQMSKLRIRRGEEVSRAAAIRNQSDDFRREGARLMAVAPYAFRML